MEVKEIIDNIRFNNGKYEKQSVIEARQHKEEITEELLKELNKVASNIKQYTEADDNYMLHLYAMFLLAEFREKRAYPIIIKLIQQDQEDVDYLLGDVITESLGSILASTFDGDIQSLYNIITNTELNEFIRTAAFHTLEILEKYNIISREQIISKIDEMLQNELKDDDSYVITNIVTFISENSIFEKKNLVKELYDNYRVNERAIGRYDDFIDDLYGNKTYHEKKEMIDDVEKEISWWACFNKGKTKGLESFSTEDFVDKFIKMEKKKVNEATNTNISRNDPCPCGSGKKYKKCCMNKQELQIITPADYYLKKSLKDYPKEELKNFYDEETIAIDEKLYTALKHKAVPLFVDRNYTEEARRDMKNMNEAIELMKEKCKKESIANVEEFNNKIAIHYDFEQIVRGYLKILNNRSNPYNGDYKTSIKLLVNILQIIRLDNEYKEKFVNEFIEDCIDEDLFDEAEDVITVLKNEFPELKQFLDTKLLEINEIRQSY